MLRAGLVLEEDPGVVWGGDTEGCWDVHSEVSAVKKLFMMGC